MIIILLLVKQRKTQTFKKDSVEIQIIVRTLATNLSTTDSPTVQTKLHYYYFSSVCSAS